MSRHWLTVNSLDVVSTAVSTIVALVSFVVPPTVHPKSMLDMLMEDVRELVGLTRNSKRQELTEFGEYVDRMVCQLIRALQDDQLMQKPNIVKNLEAFRRTLHMILCQISDFEASRGLRARARRILFTEQVDTDRMRQRLNDSLSAFQFGALLALLANGPDSPIGGVVEYKQSHHDESNPMNVLSVVVDTPESGQYQTPGPSDSSAEEHLHTKSQWRRTSRMIEQVQDSDLPYSCPDTHSYSTHSYTRVSRNPHSCAPVARSSGPEDGKIPAAFMNVERYRRSLQHNRSPIQKLKLAAALDHLSPLLDKAGRTREALEASQESTELYKSLAESVQHDCFTSTLPLVNNLSDYPYNISSGHSQ
ncbi:hypothetical protein FRC11_013008 [Ceratobasidium sp. 423]|nr:hypothetical protein FRC11_013008 [Ceratobasidium sp. 423]